MIANNSMVMTPREIVQELDKHIIGQDDAKRAVAIALRNRWRRMKIQDPVLRNEIMPKNILMIGPTGVPGHASSTGATGPQERGGA